MRKRAMSILFLALLASGLAGCSKCGWLWDQNTRSCHADTPLTR